MGHQLSPASRRVGRFPTKPAILHLIILASGTDFNDGEVAITVTIRTLLRIFTRDPLGCTARAWIRV